MNTEQLDAIQSRIADCTTYNFGMRNADKLAKEDAPYLLALAREQAAIIAAVRDLANSAGRCGWRISADDIRKTLGKP